MTDSDWADAKIRALLIQALRTIAAQMLLEAGRLE